MDFDLPPASQSALDPHVYSALYEGSWCNPHIKSSTKSAGSPGSHRFCKQVHVMVLMVTCKPRRPS